MVFIILTASAFYAFGGNLVTRAILMSKQRVIVVGGGLAGLAATMKIAELGMSVLLVSFQPVKRSHSVCAQGE
ncbi:MAG: hypothetical protein Ct9H300mP28_33400 [Pseudomonadota bacterium]|nr:MAG: hypothetical protein Ct9H300mP28_33400 [Pseudomonadota bacterium]